MKTFERKYLADACRLPAIQIYQLPALVTRVELDKQVPARAQFTNLFILPELQ